LPSDAAAQRSAASRTRQRLTLAPHAGWHAPRTEPRAAAPSCAGPAKKLPDDDAGAGLPAGLARVGGAGAPGAFDLSGLQNLLNVRAPRALQSHAQP
jgi:hypothetical protein